MTHAAKRAAEKSPTPWSEGGGAGEYRAAVEEYYRSLAGARKKQ